MSEGGEPQMVPIKKSGRSKIPSPNNAYKGTISSYSKVS
jgi:hypothetical protein